jgi:hypothetical protein
MYKKGIRERINLDMLGISASVLCAVHCSLLPVLLTVGALGGLSWLRHPLVEVVFIMLSLLLAFFSLLPSWRKAHGRLEPILLMLAGFACIVLSRLLGEGLEPALMTIGGLTIAAAHLLNWRLMRKYACCIV